MNEKLDPVHAEAVETASELMNKHHDALDTINEAVIHLNNGDVKAARASLLEFQVRWDSTGGEE